MTRVAVVQLCEQLWERVGEIEAFPRNLEGLYIWALPIARVVLPALWADDVQRWLEQHVLEGSVGPQRRLHACLIAREGRGFVLIDGSDPPEEQRLSLAHEAGHFLLDYDRPRQQVGATLGPTALPLLDGSRAPSQQERVLAVLNGFALQPHIHLMERDGDGLTCGAVAGAECAADELALELLAPEAVVLAMLPAVTAGAPFATRVGSVETLLRRQFGLPRRIAAPYARRLLRLRSSGPDTAEWLGLHHPLPGLGEGRGEGRRSLPGGG